MYHLHYLKHLLIYFFEVMALNAKALRYCSKLLLCVSNSTNVALRTIHVALHLDVELNLRFCA